MMKNGPNHKSGEISRITFQKDDPINYELEITGKSLVALQPNHPLHSIVYPGSEENSSTPFNLLILLK